jgi:hypothetical protein
LTPKAELQVPPEAVPAAKGEENKKESSEKDSGNPLDRFEEKTRWIIPPRGSQPLFIKFYSEKIGEFKQPLHFEVVGTEKSVEVALTGKCEYPQLNDKPKIVFSLYERKGGKNSPMLKKFDMKRNVFSFGSLLIGKEYEKRMTEKCKVNFAELYLQNAGSFHYILISHCSHNQVNTQLSKNRRSTLSQLLLIFQ